MAFIKYLFLAVMATAFSLVENAPQTVNIKNLKDELQLRLVFVNKNDENTVISNAPAVSDSSLPNVSTMLQKKHLAITDQLTEPVFAPQATNAATRRTDKPTMDDERQNWGVIIVDDESMPEDESFYNRPLSLPRIVKTKVVERKPSKVESKSTVMTTVAPAKPSACDTAVITCCARPTMLKKCFETVGCPNATEDMLSHLCSDSYIKQVIEDFATYYKRD